MSEPIPSAATPVVPAGPAYGALPVREDEYDRQPPLTEVQRVADAYFAPSKTFADIRRNRSWWLPFLLIAVLGYVFAFTVTQRVGIHNLAQNTLRANPAQAEKMNSAPPEQRASIMKITELSMKFGLFAGPVVVLLWQAFLALLLWAGFNFILGGSSTYPGMFAVSIFAALPSLVQTAVILLTLFLGDAESFNLANPLGTNPGFYMGPETSAALRTLLTSIDVFTLWQVLLLGLGGAILARVKPARGIALVAGVWFAVVLVRVGIAAATS